MLFVDDEPNILESLLQSGRIFARADQEHGPTLSPEHL